jgi:hypothetical protein
VINLLTPRKSARSGGIRALIARLSDSVAEFRSAAPVPAPAAVEPDTSDFFGPDDMPADADIAEALAEFARAADQARAAERVKRRSKKLIDRLAAGVYGRFEVVREPSGRATVDLEAVRAHYKSLGLELPMKSAAPSLRVNRVVVDVPELADAEFAALAVAMTR